MVNSLHEAYQKGFMSEEQRVHYRRFIRRVQELLPLIDRLGLERPGIHFEEVFREQAAARL